MSKVAQTTGSYLLPELYGFDYDQISRLKSNIPALPENQEYFRKNGLNWSGYNY
jgi:hypothetical protein